MTDPNVLLDFQTAMRQARDDMYLSMAQPDEGEKSVQRLSQQRLLVTGLAALALAPVSTNLAPHSIAEADASASKPSYCQPATYNAKLCEGTNADKVTSCANVAVDSLRNLKATYVKGSKSKFKVSYILGDMGGCAEIGTREVISTQEKKQPNSNEFTTSSDNKTIKQNKRGTIGATVNAPMNCPTGPDGSYIPGTQIRGAVKVVFLPKKQFGNPKPRGLGGRPFNPMKYSREQKIC